MLTPKIEGVSAAHYLSGVPDNKRKLIIIGDAPRKWRQAAQAAELAPDHDNMAINGSAAGGFTHYMATVHSNEIGDPAIAAVQDLHEQTHVIGLRCGCEAERVDQTIAAEPVGGTSALFAVIAGLVLGYKTIYLAGVELKPGTIYYDEHVEQNWKLWHSVLSPHLTVIAEGWLKELYS